MENIKRWSRGRLLLTPNTRRFTKELWDKEDARENLTIFSNFTSLDAGCSREYVCSLNPNHSEFEFNRSLIENAPSMYLLLKKVASLGSVYQKDVERLLERIK